MSNPNLRRGDKGEDVFRLQSRLNRIGAMLYTDGDFGYATDIGVRYAQDFANQPVTGIADSLLRDWLQSRPEPFPKLDTNGVAFIALEETGGLDYYQKNTQWPHFPGEASGVTIGVGYDLRWNTEADFLATWGNLLPDKVIHELITDIGKRGTKARARELRRIGIAVPFKFAWSVFVEKTLPRFYADSKAIYPSLDHLPGLCRAVLVSIVFNRGNDLRGDKRKEMRAIQMILNRADQAGLNQSQHKLILAEVEEQIVSMKRLWAASSGVFKRRQAEANLWRSGLARW
ncbi:MAG: peptidoglycan-binding protein [Desulfobacterales bacterium]|jgi:peptidoglycan hydrolase-like protein with peptidoglycan-binding domain|nr:peptidoglycan-binding protein [Desulfobacterales bacterium]